MSGALVDLEETRHQAYKRLVPVWLPFGRIMDQEIIANLRHDLSKIGEHL